MNGRMNICMKRMVGTSTCVHVSGVCACELPFLCRYVHVCVTAIGSDDARMCCTSQAALGAVSE